MTLGISQTGQRQLTWVTGEYIEPQFAKPAYARSRNATKRDYRLTLDDNDKQRLDLPHAIIHWWLMLGDCTPKSKLLLSQAIALATGSG